MKKNIIKIFAGLFVVGVLTACSETDAYHFLRMGNKGGEWGNDIIDVFGFTNDDDGWGNFGDDSSDGGHDNSGTSNSGSSNKPSSNNSNQGGYSTDLNYTYTVGSGECAVYAASSLKDENVVVPATYTDSNDNVYTVKRDCNNGFCALVNVKTITFSDGFERINVGFGSCINLVKLVLPSSLIKIDARILVNCSSFKTIEFKGTKAQWNAVEKIESWNDMAPEFTVSCSDGNIVVPVYIDE